MQREITTVFTVTSYKTGNFEQILVKGSGQAAATKLMDNYPRHTKFVLDGFFINGNFVALYIKNRHHDRY